MVETYLYHNVVIAPSYSPENYWLTPSMLGCVGIKQPYGEHIRGYHMVSRKVFTTRYEVRIDDLCVFAGHFYFAWGHFLIETLSRLYFLKQLPSTVPLVFNFDNMGSLDMFSWQKELLALYGITNPLLILKKPTLFANIYIPPPGATLDGYILPEQFQALQLIKCQPARGKKLWVSRSRLRGNGGCRNEEAIDDLLTSRGWEIMHPENLSVSDQLAQLGSSQIVFGVNGSAWHSILMLEKPHQRFIVIPRNHCESYNVIAHAKCPDYWLLDLPKLNLEFSGNWSGAWFDLDIARLESLLNASSDFENIEQVTEKFICSPAPRRDPFARPAWLDTPLRSTPADNMFYKILKSVHTDVLETAAIKCLITLIEKRLLASWMTRRCGEFLLRFYPDAHTSFTNWIKAKFQSKDNHNAAAALVVLLNRLYQLADN